MTDESSLNYLAPLARMFAAVGPQLAALLDAYRTGGGCQLGPARRRRARVPGRHEPAMVRAGAGGRASLRCPLVHDVLAAPGAASPTSGAGPAGRPSRWPGRTPAPGSRLRRGCPVDRDGARPTPVGRGLRPGVVHGGRRRRAARRASSTRPSPSSASTTCPGRSRCSAPSRRALAPAGSWSSWTRRWRTSSRPAATSWSGYVRLQPVGLPPGRMSSPPSVGTGTVMRPSTLRRYAEEAGFTRRGAAHRGLRLLAVLPALLT